MTTRKYNAVKAMSHTALFPSTFTAIFQTIERNPVFGGMTARQIAAAIDAAFESYQFGFHSGVSA